MSKLVWQVALLVASAALFASGLRMLAWPEAVVLADSELAKGITPREARWNARVAGAIMVLLGLAGLYLVLLDG